jgi:S-(hydroxymethyl)glutathione dehydrogenase/alcohol dehydrogenase
MLPGMSRRLSWRGGEPMHQFLNLSAFAEQMLVHENALVKIDPEVPLDRATLVGCGVITASARCSTRRGSRPAPPSR